MACNGVNVGGIYGGTICDPHLNRHKNIILKENMAEAQGFEPWVPLGTLVFKTSAIDHSAKLP